MIATHSVKYDGVWYHAGEEIKVGDKLSSTNLSNNENLVKTSQSKYTKTEINRMSTTDLQELAKNSGIENAGELTGAELKKLLIEKFGL